MAEFTEVMKQARRMCKAHICYQGCPLLKENCWFVPETEEDLEAIEESERAVMDWAAAHPEPKYPTWYAWLVKIGVISWAKFDEDYHTHVYRCVMDSSIPADIAEKLGIEPIKEE